MAQTERSAIYRDCEQESGKMVTSSASAGHVAPSTSTSSIKGHRASTLLTALLVLSYQL
jgi:hypothetical protein